MLDLGWTPGGEDMTALVILAGFLALVGGLAIIGIAWAQDRPEDMGRVSDAWRRSNLVGRE